MEEETMQPVDETTETTPSQEQTDSTVEVPSEESEVVSDESTEGASETVTTDEEASKRSPRQEKRFAKMSSKIRELSEQQSKPVDPMFGAYDQPYQQPYQEANQSYDYTQDVARQAEMIADLKLQQYEQKQQARQIAENFERDVDLIERKYPELNADGDKYDSALSNKIASMYEKLSGKNPDIRLRDIVDDVMEVATRQSNRANADVSASVAKAAAEQTIKPDASTPTKGSKDFTELSLKEMEEQLGFN
jgi:hypothetical protein